MRRKTIALAALGLAVLAAAWFFLGPSQFRPSKELQAALDGIVDSFRKIIVLIDGVESLDETTRARSLVAGRRLFWRKQQALQELTQELTADYERAAAARYRRHTDGIRQLLQYLTANPALRDADKLAFLELVEELAAATPQSQGRSRNPLADPLKGLLDNLQSIQLSYREEVTRIFSQLGTRGAAGEREKWESYVKFLRGFQDREKILAELGEIPEELEGLRGDRRLEVFGYDFPAKSVALTFDDGPHPKYTELVLALLRKYDARGCFFLVGRNLGEAAGADQLKLSRGSEIARRILEAGHVLANHSYSHASRPGLSEAQRAREIQLTNLLLEKISGRKPDLFRPPYGVRSKGVLEAVTAAGMRSVMWNIDSLDWADPIPESISLRVLREVSRTRKGILLFHDIHKQSVAALPQILEELRRQEYSFLTFENGRFVAAKGPVGAERAESPEPAPAVASRAQPRFYRESWAIIIGINQYQNWAKLRYAVNDANAIEQTLIDEFSFKRENVWKLLDREASRARIMALLGDELSNPDKVHRDDRLLFFFAGHGATRTMHDGREVGFIIPVDADRSNYYSTAISMTALREVCDLIPAKHIYFIMDSCYSGLALTRGAGAFARNRSYLEEITRRAARQILTAGGADQQVADDGPHGHSVFTWTLLQGLHGPADLDANGVITASELGAYASPIVSSLSRQTPAMGNLIGSEGGEFIFELQPEPLTALSQQLEGKGLELNQQLVALEKQVQAKQEELLQLQQSIRAESARLVQLRGSGAVVAARGRTGSAHAYELDRQGRQFYREKKYNLALPKFQEAVRLKPKDPVLLNNLAYVYYKRERYQEALSWLEKTLALDPKRKEAHGNIADTYLKLGRTQEARRHYEQYLELFPGSPRREEVRRILRTLN